MAKLGDVFNLQMGKTPARANLAYWTDGANEWVSIADLSSKEKYVEGTKERITGLAVQESGIKKIPANTVIMSFKLSLGKTAITKTPVYTNEAIMAFLPSGKYDVYPDYFFHLFSGKDWSEGTNRAVMGATLNKATISNIEIDVPPLEEQHRIADILDKVTDLINKRRAQLDKLDLLVKSRFIEMFGNPKQNPNGYPMKEFNDISVLITDGEHVTPRRVEKGIFLLSARNVLNHALNLDDVDYIDEDEYTRISRRVVPQGGDVLISCSGSIGRCCVVPDGLQFQMVRSTALIRFDDSINPIFAEWLITSDELQRQISMAATQSSQANLFQGKIKKLRGYVPPMSLQTQFASFVTQTNELKLLIQQNLDELKKLKAAIIQTYFN